jgi:hypothetical protein
MIGPVEQMPLQLTEVEAFGVRLVVRPGLEIAVERVGEQLLAARIEALGILVFGSNRQSLCDSLESAIAETWQRYMDIEGSGRSREASAMRYQLISRFRQY